MKCDICGSESYTRHIQEWYRTDDVKEVCEDCEKVINDKLDKIKETTQKINESLIKRFITYLKNKK